MSKSLKKNAHWLVAAWPGMGNVSMLAAGYLVQKLGMKQVGEFTAQPGTGLFEPEAVEVKKGVVRKTRLPRMRLYQQVDAGADTKKGEAGDGTEPGAPRLTVFIGESHPTTGGHAFAGELLAKAAELGVDRVVTFASMASPVHPLETPRVFGAATSVASLDELKAQEVQPLAQGMITGMSGLVLGAAAERGMPAVCLLTQVPGFAPGIPNPRATAAVLGAFGTMTGREIDTDDLAPHIEAVDGVLMQMLEKIEEMRARGGDGEGRLEYQDSFDADEDEEDEGVPLLPASPEKADVDEAVNQRIEVMFTEAAGDRTKAGALKIELDGLGVFARYEDRFLDLFKPGMR